MRQAHLGMQAVAPQCAAGGGQRMSALTTIRNGRCNHSEGPTFVSDLLDICVTEDQHGPSYRFRVRFALPERPISDPRCDQQGRG
ncbi:hypothetical protein FAIPA1_240050 [Frankia sp. AiPs1]